MINFGLLELFWITQPLGALLGWLHFHSVVLFPSLPLLFLAIPATPLKPLTL